VSETAAKSTPAAESTPVADTEAATKSEPAAKSTPVAESKPVADSKAATKSEASTTSTPVAKSDPVAKPEAQTESDEDKARLLAQTIQASAVAAGAVTIQPIPLLDLALVTPIQATMVQTIGSIHGYKMDARTVMELMGTFGTGIATQQFVLAASKFVPVLGWAASITTAYAMTWAIGEVADEYFAHGRKMSNVELNQMFHRVFRAKKAEKQASVSAGSPLKNKLGQLTAARDADLITADEFMRKKEQLLADF
jgi:uncharacterized protein (DUF697 family)